MLLKVVIFSVTFLFLGNVSSGDENDTLINLPNGKIRGRILETPDGVPYYAYQGVPYGKPPIGDLRFKAPEPAENWDGVLDTIIDSRTCIELNSKTPNRSEDCLFLNVYVPKTKNETKLPVMFYIHGGAFRGGSSQSKYYGPDYFVEEGVILVTINYRLTVFGFLATEDMVAPGNMGIKDALLALKWVNSNIHLFGGDPEKITIFGQSAGSVAISYLVLSKQTKGLFRAAIHESGTTLNMFNFQRHPKTIAYRIATLIDENFNHNSTTQEVFNLLSNASVDHLIKATQQVTKEYPEDTFKNINYGHIFGGVIEPEHEDAIITEKMYEIYKNKKGNDIPQIIGCNSQEAVLKTADLDAFIEVLKLYDSNYSALVPGPMYVNGTVDKNELGRLIKEIYVGPGKLSDNPELGIRFVSDIWINRALIKAAKLTSEYADLYFYIFSYEGPLGQSNYPIKGVAHHTEIYYLFKDSRIDLNDYPENDKLTHRRMVRLWTNFAKTLNPTPENDSLLNNTKWPLAKSQGDDRFMYLDIGSNLEVKDDPKGDTLAKWGELFEKYGNRPYDTY